MPFVSKIGNAGGGHQQRWWRASAALVAEVSSAGGGGKLGRRAVSVVLVEAWLFSGQRCSAFDMGDLRVLQMTRQSLD